jgi:hypothetical protein
MSSIFGASHLRLTFANVYLISRVWLTLAQEQKTRRPSPAQENAHTFEALEQIRWIKSALPADLKSNVFELSVPLEPAQSELTVRRRIPGKVRPSAFPCNFHHFQRLPLVNWFPRNSD